MTISPSDEKSNIFAGEAEKTNHRPANPGQRDYLFSVAMFALGIGAEVPLRSDEATALFRIAQGKGSQVELFKIQNDPGDGRGFMAMLTPRIHALRHRYGFDIQNRVERDPGGNRSWYWLELNLDGTPKMNAVELAQPKTGTPKKRPMQPEPPMQDERGQGLMFGESRRSMQPARTGKNFMDYERGA